MIPQRHEQPRKSWQYDVLFAVSELSNIDKQSQLTQMASSGIPTTSVVILAIHALESGSLVYGDRAGSILILLERVVDSSALGGEVVRPPALRG